MESSWPAFMERFELVKKCAFQHFQFFQKTQLSQLWCPDYLTYKHSWGTNGKMILVSFIQHLFFKNSATGEHTIALWKSDPSKCSLLSWVILAVLVKGWGISTANAKHQEIASNIFFWKANEKTSFLYTRNRGFKGRQNSNLFPCLCWGSHQTLYRTKNYKCDIK